MKVQLLILFAAAQAALAQSGPLVTITNPMPTLFQGFGNSVAALGNDRLLVSAPYEAFVANPKPDGAVFLFDNNGTLLATLTNPIPTPSGYFGNAMCPLGSDRVVIGAFQDNTAVYKSGAAYLFSSNGTLLQTFPKPNPAYADAFGWSVAVVGETVLIGAYSDSSTAGGYIAGAAYLFITNGSVAMTFTNPVSEIQPHFSDKVVAVGDDRVLISSTGGGIFGEGAVYLFSTNGALLTTFTNPTPSPYDAFGSSVVAANNHVLIGNSAEDVGRGAAYLFRTDGTLLHTFINPTPATNEGFGVSLALTDGRVVISASGDHQGAQWAGAAYLFSTNGTLLATWTNPVPSQSDYFGKALAMLGNDRIIISANRAVYIYALPDTRVPTLTVTLAAPGQSTISWSPDTPDFVLQETLSLAISNWTNSPSGTTNPVVVPTTSPAKFYRLLKP